MWDTLKAFVYVVIVSVVIVVMTEYSVRSVRQYPPSVYYRVRQVYDDAQQTVEKLDTTSDVGRDLVDSYTTAVKIRTQLQLLDTLFERQDVGRLLNNREIDECLDNVDKTVETLRSKIYSRNGSDHIQRLGSFSYTKKGKKIGLHSP